MPFQDLLLFFASATALNGRRLPESSKAFPYRNEGLVYNKNCLRKSPSIEHSSARGGWELGLLRHSLACMCRWGLRMRGWMRPSDVSLTGECLGEGTLALFVTDGKSKTTHSAGPIAQIWKPKTFWIFWDFRVQNIWIFELGMFSYRVPRISDKDMWSVCLCVCLIWASYSRSFLTCSKML